MRQPIRIGLYGGSFNPIHCGHVMIAHWALMTGEYDKLYVVPTFKHNFGKALLDYDARFQMVQMAFEHLNGFVEVSPVEQQIGNSITANTVEYLKEHLEAVGYAPQFTMLIGTDVADQLDNWTGIDRLRKLANFQVIDRSLYAEGISSTDIRIALATWVPDRESGLSDAQYEACHYLEQALPRKVLRMIVNNEWYKEKS